MSYPGDSTGQSPVFFVRGADRDVQLAKRLPIHVLPLPEPSTMTCIEQLAAGYVSTIRRIQPFGPYRLLGKAFGGLVAYEVANQLLGHDEPVDFLGMIDSSRPRNLPLQKSGSNPVLAVSERYCPQPLPIPVYFFVSDERSELEAARAWRALAGDSLRVITSSGALSEDILADAIERAPKQEFLQNSTDQDTYSPLVTVQVGPCSETPMIFAPGAGGSVTSFMALAQSLREPTTIHGLQPRGFSGASVPHRTVQAAATAYLRAIRKVRPHGPYRLAGHSFGGWIVFELACRLAAEGEVVDPIVLIDSEAPSSTDAKSRHHSRVDVLVKLIGAVEELSERSMNLTRQELESLDYETQLLRLTQGMKMLGLLHRSSDVIEIRGLVRVFEVNLNTSYLPTTRFPGCAVLLQAAEPSRCTDEVDEYNPDEMCKAWRGHVTHLELASVPGKHMTMLKKPHVEVIADHLSKLWSKPRRNGSGLLYDVEWGSRS